MSPTELMRKWVERFNDTAILQWRDPIGLKGCGFFQFKDNQIIHQKGYFDQLTFFQAQGIPIPEQYLDT